MENKQLSLIDANDTQTVENMLREIEEAYYDIPLGNTAFQTKNFVMAAAITPERAYRAIGLQMLSVLNSIKSQIIDEKIFEVKLEQKKEKLKSTDLDTYEKQILELEILRDSSGTNYRKKLLNDSMHEFNVLYEEFKKYPRYTREQFESAEYNYFSQSLDRQARGVSGAIESLINMNEDLPALASYAETVQKLENLNNEVLDKLRLSMPNQLDVIRKKEEQRAMELRRSQM